MAGTTRKLTALYLALILVMSATAAGAFAGSIGAQQAGNDPGNNGTIQSFTVANLGAPIAVEQGETVTVTAVVGNPNDERDIQELEYRFDGAVVARKEVALTAGESTTVTFSFDTSNTDTGQSFHGVYTETRGADAPITIADNIRSFEVTNLTAPETATVGETLTVNATVRNPNEFDDNQSVEFRLDGDLIDSRDIVVEGNSSTTVEFQVETGGIPPGEYVHSVFTRDLGQSALIVLEADDGGEDPEAPDNGGEDPETPDDGDDPDGGENESDQ